jgi:hypothetical protein
VVLRKSWAHGIKYRAHLFPKLGKKGNKLKAQGPNVLCAKLKLKEQALSVNFKN